MSSKRTLPQVALPPAKRASQVVEPPVPVELGELIQRDVELLSQVGWQTFVKQRRSDGDIASLNNINHPARRLLLNYKHRGAPVKFSTAPWTPQRINQAIKRGPHRSCIEYTDFLAEEFVDMIQKGQWVILPASVAKQLSNLRISPPGVVPQRGRRPRWICDYTWSNVNQDTIPLAAMEAMQFGHALERILREILLANVNHGFVYLNKTDLSDGFYRVGLVPEDIPKLGVIFPPIPGQPEPLVALPLVLPMGWKNSPPIFSTATETIADITNQRLSNPLYHPHLHHLDEMAADVILPDRPASPTSPVDTGIAVPVPSTRDPCLPTTGSPLQYVDIFVDDFVSLAQAPYLRRVRRSLLHAIDDVIRPVSSIDSPFRREPVSLKKLRQGDCSWDTIKLVLGWVIDTERMTLHLPQHRVDRYCGRSWTVSLLLRNVQASKNGTKSSENSDQWLLHYRAPAICLAAYKMHSRYNPKLGCALRKVFTRPLTISDGLLITLSLVPHALLNSFPSSLLPKVIMMPPVKVRVALGSRVPP